MVRRLFLLPHPDDEFAVAGHIRDAVRAGDAMQVVYLTDGGYSGQDVHVRERESLHVLARLGVASSSVVFLGREHGFPDGSLHAHLPRARKALHALVAATGAPDRVYLPAWEGGHQDHDAGHLLGLSLEVPGARLRQFPLYHGAGLPGPLFRVMSPLVANGCGERRPASLRERLEMMRTCFSYPSQRRTWLGLTPFVLLHVLRDGGFYLQPVNPDRILQPPHAGRPLYERRGFLAWQVFAETTASFRQGLLARVGEL